LKLDRFFHDNQIIPKLEINQIDLSLFTGPFDNSNWIIKDHILVGCYPLNHLKILEDVGITDFICLQTPEELEKIGPYITYLLDSQRFHNFPIPDRCVVADKIMNEYMKQINTILSDTSRRIYIHCLGGHGRTGVVVSLLLAHKYRISGAVSLQLCQKLHDARWVKTGKIGKPHRFKSPQTAAQFKQVNRLSCQ